MHATVANYGATIVIWLGAGEEGETLQKTDAYNRYISHPFVSISPKN
ncbi:MAG: hypothetical protein ACUVRP_05810 [Chlorobiales bacterium]